MGNEVKKANDTGAELLVIVAPKDSKDCAIVAGIDFINFITIYAELVARISAKLFHD